MRAILPALVILILAVISSGQNDVDRLVATERSFAALAAEKGTRHAFLQYIADDGLLFLPDKINGKAYWNARGESPGLLAWAPNAADVSSNGILGYTTGNWEYRPAGAGGEPTGFGEFVTVWVRYPNGYKFVVDIGIAHPKPAAFSSDLTDERPGKSDRQGPTGSAADTANSFFAMVSTHGIGRAYSVYSDANVRFFRENEMPGKGKDELTARAKRYKGTFTIPKRSLFFESADLAYVTNRYSMNGRDGKTESGNFLQVWKFIDGKWKIVLDIFKPVPEKAGPSAGMS